MTDPGSVLPTPPSHPIRVAVGPAMLVAVLALAGCGGTRTAADVPGQAPTASDPPSPSAPSDSGTASSAPTSPSTSSAKPETEPAGPILEITIEGDTVLPNAAELELALDEPLRLSITSDRGGELHVHSKPEQYVEFDPGSSNQELVIVTPGTVEVEDHETGAVVAVIEAS